MGPAPHSVSLTSPSNVRGLLEQLGHVPRKALGQSFLIDRNILNILVAAAAPCADDVVLEVGPGLGVLTRELVGRAGRVLAVEKDSRLFGFLEGDMAGATGLSLVCADMLDLDVDALPGTLPNKVVSNLPYSVGTRILVNLARAQCPPDLMVVTVQEEVARRLAAAPGSPDRGAVSVWIQRLFRVEIVKLVSPTCFWPRPEVSSAIVRMSRHGANPLAPLDEAAFYELTRRAFMHRRKQLTAILSRLPEPGGGEVRRRLGPAGVDEQARPGELTVEQWCRLASAGIDTGSARK